MIIKKIGVLGGSGFVGRTLANHLSREGYALKVFTRNREARRHNLIVLPNLDLVEANIHDQAQLSTHLSDCDAVINLVGILNERGWKGAGFHYVHVELTDKIIRACQENNIRRLLHVSAINADATGGASHYLRSKGQAEDKAHAAEGIYVTSYRPSVIFGKEDGFFNRFAGLLEFIPFIFPLACAHARFSPVFVEDVAKAMTGALVDSRHYGKRYELCGPSTYTLQELVEFTAECIDRKRIIVPLPDFISRVQARVFDLAGFLFHVLGIEQPFSTDNYLSTRLDAVCRRNDLVTLGISPTAIEGIVPAYLANNTQRAKYAAYRQGARRDKY